MSTELTREIVRAAPQVTNAIKQRELSLRGLHLAQLPVTDGQLWEDIVTNFDCLDLSENMLQWLDAPALPSHAVAAAAAAASTSSQAAPKPQPLRLTSLLLHKNRVRGISRQFATQLSPSITSILLHDNAFTDLSDLDVFAHFAKLERLSLCGNPVQERPGYRLHLISICAPSLKLLDFAKVKDAERLEAAEFRKKRKMELEEQQQQQQASTSTTKNGGGGVLGGGRRAARKAAALADHEQKRPAGSTEERLGEKSIGDIAADSRKQQQQNAAGAATKNGQQQQPRTAEERQKRREELMAALDAATSLEDMDRIEQELASLE